MLVISGFGFWVVLVILVFSGCCAVFGVYVSWVLCFECLVDFFWCDVCILVYLIFCFAFCLDCAWWIWVICGFGIFVLGVLGWVDVACLLFGFEGLLFLVDLVFGEFSFCRELVVVV